MYVYICSSPNSNDIPRWQKVIMMTSGRILKKKFLCIRFTFSCSVKSIRFMYFATERFFKCPIKLFSRTIENLQWLHFCVLPRVAFQMSSQITPLNRWKVTLVAFVCFCPECRHKWCARVNFKSHWCYLCGLSEVFRCPLKRPASAHAWSLWLHLDNFSPEGVLKCTQKWLAFEDA